MLMKLVHHDITETSHTGIDHRVNAVFNASDKHSIKRYKRRTEEKKTWKTKVNIVSVGCCSREAFIVSTFSSFFINPWPDVMERCVKLTGGLLCCRLRQLTKASPPIMRWGCCCILGHLIRSCWYHRRCHQPFQALNRWCPLFLRSCQCPLCGSWENDLTHRQLLSAAWVILYRRFYWKGVGWGGLAGHTTANKGWDRHS